jgi:hypothetical protein
MDCARVRFILLCMLTLAAGFVAAGEAENDASKIKAPPLLDPELEKLTAFEDPDARFSMRIPAGFTRLTEADNQEVFRGISEHFGKQVGDRTLKRPPVWFKGTMDPAHPKIAPPSMAIGYTDLADVIDVNARHIYKQNLEQAYKKAGVKHGEIAIDAIQIAGVDALRIEHDIFNAIDNSQARIINLAVPGDGRRYDVVFNFSAEQSAEVETAVKTVMKTFKLKTAPAMDTATQAKWTRVAFFTIGGFVVGVVLMMLLKVLSGAGEKEPEKSGV